MGYYKRFSGVDAGSGLVDTLDEGYLCRYLAFDGMMWLPILFQVRQSSESPPPGSPPSPDYGHAAVGAWNEYPADPYSQKTIEWRGFYRFDVSSIDLSRVVRARLTWEIRSALMGGENSAEPDLQIRGGFNILGSALRTTNWTTTFPYAIATVPFGSWNTPQKTLLSYEFTDLSIFHLNAGGSPRFDIRLMVTNYVPSECYARWDPSSGDNSKTDAPYLEIWTEDVEGREIIAVSVDEGAMDARVGNGDVAVATDEGSSDLRTFSGRVGLRVHDGSVSNRVDDGGVSG